MATRLAAANINFSSASWLTVDATSLNDVETANSALTTTYQNSSAFTPGAITVDGLAIKIASRAVGTPSNTITVRLANAGVDVTGTVTTMNVSDIDPCSATLITANEGGWYYFRFNVAGTPTPVLLLAATAYTVSVKLSATTTAVSLFSLATTNWARMLATTTTGALAATDRACICGDNLAAGTHNAYTVTMDNTTTTSFGGVTTQSLTINKFSTLTWGTAASTNYILRVKGFTRVFSGGTWNMGTSGTRIPSTSTAKYQIDCTATADSGFETANGSIVSNYGATKVSFTLLTIDKAVAATVITGLTSTTGWQAGDTLMFESSTTTGTQTETKIILTVDSSTQVTLTAGLTNAHSGTSPTQIQVANLTRNTSFISVSSTLTGCIFVANTATAVFDNIEFAQTGSSTTNRRGIDITTTTGSCTINNCAVHDGTVATSIGINITGGTSNNYIITNNVVYNMNAGGLNNTATAGSNWTITSNLVVSTGSGAAAGNIVLAAIKGTVTNNISSNNNSGYGITISAIDTPGTFSGNQSHSCGTSSSGNIGITGGILFGTLSTIKSWRAGGASGSGIVIISDSECTIDSANIFGNQVAGINITGGTGKIEFANCTIDAGVTNVQPIGLQAGGATQAVFNSCTFGATNLHTTADISINGFLSGQMLFNNCLLASTTELNNQANLTPAAYIGSEQHDQTVGKDVGFKKYGNLARDTAITTMNPSLRMTPNTVGIKLESGSPGTANKPISLNVKSGVTYTVSITVRTSVAGDGQAYNGNFPVLIAKKNYSLGLTSDTVLATATIAASGSPQQITGTITPTGDGCLDIIVNCDGTAGWVNSGSFVSSPSLDSTGFVYWQNGSPSVYANNVTAGGGGGGFVIL